MTATVSGFKGGLAFRSAHRGGCLSLHVDMQMKEEHRENRSKLATQFARRLSVAVLSAGTPASAQQPAAKPNILFIMGDDIGWMQPSIYHRGLMVGETPSIDRIGQKAQSSWTMWPCRAARPGAMPSSPECTLCAPAWSASVAGQPKPTCSLAPRARPVPD
jgi:hypothetical protein